MAKQEYTRKQIEDTIASYRGDYIFFSHRLHKHPCEMYREKLRRLEEKIKLWETRLANLEALENKNVG